MVEQSVLKVESVANLSSRPAGLLALTSQPGDSAAVIVRQAGMTSNLMLVAWAFEGFKQYARNGNAVGWVFVAAAAVGLTLLRTGRVALAAGFSLMGVGSLVGVTFPTTANHVFLMLLVIGLCFAAQCRRRIALEIGAGLRWLAVATVFGSGVQKVLHGAWDKGELFAFQLATSDVRFGLLRHLISDTEGDRISALMTSWPDSSFQFEEPAPILAALLIVGAELTVPLFALWPTTRTFAVWGSIALLATAQLLAFEVTFAIVAISLWSFFLPIDSFTSIHRSSIAVLLLCFVGLAMNPAMLN